MVTWRFLAAHQESLAQVFRVLVSATCHRKLHSSKSFRSKRQSTTLAESMACQRRGYVIDTSCCTVSSSFHQAIEKLRTAREANSVVSRSPQQWCMSRNCWFSTVISYVNYKLASLEWEIDVNLISFFIFRNKRTNRRTRSNPSRKDLGFSGEYNENEQACCHHYHTLHWRSQTSEFGKSIIIAIFFADLITIQFSLFLFSRARSAWWGMEYCWPKIRHRTFWIAIMLSHWKTPSSSCAWSRAYLKRLTKAFGRSMQSVICRKSQTEATARSRRSIKWSERIRSNRTTPTHAVPIWIVIRKAS